MYGTKERGVRRTIGKKYTYSQAAYETEASTMNHENIHIE